MTKDVVVPGVGGNACRGRVVGVGIVPKEGEWFKETYVVTGPGRVVVVREHYTLPAEPPQFDEPLMENSRATRDVSVDGLKCVSGWRTGRSHWLQRPCTWLTPDPRTRYLGTWWSLWAGRWLRG